MIHPTVVRHPTSIIGDDVKIGKRTRVMEFAIIRDGAEIGDDCEIMEHCVIGALPVNYNYLDLTRANPLFGVKLGNKVRLHAGSSVCSGTERPTSIDDNSVLGQKVTVGHDSHIGKRVIIVNHSTLGGWVEIGDMTVLHLNCTVRNRGKIGSNVEVGMGSNVTGDIPSNCIAYGNPARVIRQLGFDRIAKNYIKSVMRRLGLYDACFT